MEARYNDSRSTQITYNEREEGNYETFEKTEGILGPTPYRTNQA